jgi:hypothetical protein
MSIIEQILSSRRARGKRATPGAGTVLLRDVRDDDVFVPQGVTLNGFAFTIDKRRGDFYDCRSASNKQIIRGLAWWVEVSIIVPGVGVGPISPAVA